MSWIAEYDTQGKEFPTCVHVTKTTGTMTHGATYVPIEDGSTVRAEKAALERRIDELCAEVERLRNQLHDQQDTAGHNFVRNAREYKRVCDENEKLREFIRLKETCWKYVGFCDACPYNGVDEEHHDFNCTVQEDVNSLARELGNRGKLDG